MATKLTRLTHKIAIQLHLVGQVRKRLDTPAYAYVRPGLDIINSLTHTLIAEFVGWTPNPAAEHDSEPRPSTLKRHNLSKNHLNVIVFSPSRSYKWSFPKSFREQNSECSHHLPHSSYMLSPSKLPSYHCPNRTRWPVLCNKCHIMAGPNGRAV
jgi:hypothetical protein